jgi:hypothetical protein
MKMVAIKLIEPGPWIGLDDVVALLKKRCGNDQRAWAKQHGMSQQYVNDVLRFRRLPGDKITQALGLEKALLWRTPARPASPGDGSTGGRG